MRHIIFRPDLLATLVLVALISGALVVAFPPPSTWASTPFVYEGDGLWNLFVIKTIIETGWYYDSPRLGAPFTATFLDFAKPETLHLLLIRAMGLFSDNIVLIHNGFYLLGFYAVGVAALWVLRTGIGLNWPLALAGSFLFAWLPYHFFRLPHLFLSNYFVVPIAIWIMLRIAREALPAHATVKSLLAKPSIWLASVAVASTSLYYVYFTLFLLLAIGALSAIQERRTQRLTAALAVSMVIGLVTVLNLAPSLHYKWLHGANTEVAQRSLVELDHYALNPAFMVLPPQKHRNEALAEPARRYVEEGSFINENQFASLGLISTAGFFLLLIHLLSGERLVRNLPELDTLGRINVIALLFGVTGGGGMLIGLLASPQFRAMNRISVFIAFASLAGLLLCLQQAWPPTVQWIRQRVTNRKSPNRSNFKSGKGWALFATGLIGFGFLDQTVLDRYKDPAQTKARFQSDQTYIRAIEHRLEPKAKIYQMPYIPFPEAPPLYQESTYAQLAGYLHSQTLHWSFGAFKGRPEELWHRAISRLPLSEQIKLIEQAGFQGISLNRQAMADHGRALEKSLAEYGIKLEHESQDGHLAFFRLKPTGNQPAVLPLPLVWGDGFHAEEFDGHNRWAWSRGSATLIVYSQSAKAVPVTVHLELASLMEREVTITVNDTTLKQIQLTPSKTENLKLTYTLPPGRSTLHLTTDQPPITASLLDRRRVAFMVRNIHIKP